MYDRAGRLDRAVTEVESEWDDEDRAEMQALAIIEADECPGCHRSLAETTAPDADDDWVVERTRCHVCTAIQAVQEQALADKTEYQPHALLFTARRRIH